MSQEEVIKVLISKFQENGDSNLKNISPHTMISELGKDSLSLIELGFEIEKSLKIIDLDLTLFFKEQSINEKQNIYEGIEEAIKKAPETDE